MAGSTSQVSVGTTPVQLSTDPTDSRSDSSIAVKVPSDAAVDVFVGFADDVDDTTGFPVAAGETFGMDLQGEQLYAVVTDGTVTVYVCEGGI